MAHASPWIALWIVGNLALVGVYDIYAVNRWGWENTVTAVVRGWARDYPEVTLAAGYLVCHLFGR